MLVFVDFEASSLSDRSYPIEVGWMFEDGRGEAHLIRPAPDWTDWSDEAAAIHHLDRAALLADGEPHAMVAQRMVDRLAGHDLLASAPSWDGKWLSILLRAAGLPRHALRLRSSKAARADAASRAVAPGPDRAEQVRALLAAAEAGLDPPGHRALADAAQERARWLALTRAIAARSSA